MASGDPTSDLPILVVGDVHGDLPRLFEALKPYPAERWHTIFLGDLVDYGPFGVGALRFARDRPNSTVVLGNHEVAMLWALRDPQRIGFWVSIGGQDHDLNELARESSLQEWLRLRPAMLRLPDATLVQHCGNDAYATLLEGREKDPIASINSRFQQLLQTEGEAELWDMMSGRNIFATSRERLDGWLEVTGSRRVVFGHTPHRGPKPDVQQDGKALNFDGGFSSYHRMFRHLSPPGATVAPLPPLPV
jgi:hypothetical protein